MLSSIEDLARKLGARTQTRFASRLVFGAIRTLMMPASGPGLRALAGTVSEAGAQVARYLELYDARRPHSAIEDRMADEAYLGSHRAFGVGFIDSHQPVRRVRQHRGKLLRR